MHFVFADQKPPGLRGHVGLYLDYNATSGRDYLRYPKTRRVAMLCEPNSSLPFLHKPSLAHRFALILTHDARLLNQCAPYVELPFGTSFVEHVLSDDCKFSKTKLVSMIGAPHPNPQAGHILRNQVIEVLASRSDVDRFGKGVRWIDSKLDGLADYAFSIAMENCSRDFYFTEKIIDCLLTDTVPIYCGCKGICRYFDLRGMLVFETLPELQTILDGLTWDQYTQMLPYMRANRQRAISEGWASRPQLFERVASAIVSEFGNRTLIAGPTIFQKVQDTVRKIRRLSGPKAENK